MSQQTQKNSTWFDRDTDTENQGITEKKTKKRKSLQIIAHSKELVELSRMTRILTRLDLIQQSYDIKQTNEKSAT